MSSRTKYIFASRQEAEAAYQHQQDRADRLLIMLNKHSDYTQLHESELKDGDALRVEIQIWLRPNSGLAWFTMRTGGRIVVAESDLIEFSGNWNRNNRDTECGRIIGDALQKASSAAHTMLFGEKMKIA